jgi:hypothetical protein
MFSPGTDVRGAQIISRSHAIRNALIGAGLERVIPVAALVAALVAMVAGGGAAEAEAAFPGQQGKLAYTFARQIWVANADGSDVRQLTDSPGADRSPSWSPDGAKIAFSSSRHGVSEIFVMNADGSDQRRLTFTSNTAVGRTTAWTADGQQIAYDRIFTEIYLVNADGGGGERKLTDGSMPGVSPYGNKVAFTGNPGGLVVMNLDGSERRQLTDAGQADFGADWSPGGTDLVFTRVSADDRDVYRVHENGVGPVRLTSTPARSEVAPVWSPDGTRIAFLGCPNPLGTSNCGIYITNRDGSGETQVPNLTASFAEGVLDWQPTPPFAQSPPAALNVSIAAQGASGTVTSTPEGLDCPPACATEFDRGAAVRLEAQPNANAVFLGWAGACSGRNSSCSVSMDADKRVVASFGRKTLRLTVSVRGPGRVVSSPRGIACPRRCAASFARDTRIVLRALPARGAKLLGWSGACKGARGCTVRMNADRVVRARFQR